MEKQRNSEVRVQREPLQAKVANPTPFELNPIYLHRTPSPDEITLGIQSAENENPKNDEPAHNIVGSRSMRNV